MIVHLFSVFDSKTNAYLQPFFSQAKGSALRSFMDTVADSGHPFAKHATDFSLFYLGSFDDQACRFDLLAAPEHMANAHELIQSAA